MADPRTVAYDDLESLAGQEVGVSDWHTIDQDRVNMFAEATGDHQWIHVDVERATKELGSPIAHGFLTLSLLPMLGSEVLRVSEGWRQADEDGGHGGNRRPGAPRAGRRIHYGSVRLVSTPIPKPFKGSLSGDPFFFAAFPPDYITYHGVMLRTAYMIREHSHGAHDDKNQDSAVRPRMARNTD